MTKRFLDGAYALDDSAATRRFYDEWAESYDAEIAENGYASHTRCAEALAAHAPDKGAPVLDLGCGTGLSGVALGLAGFEVIDGADPAPEMRRIAAARDGIYRAVRALDPDAPLPFAQGEYAHITAVGVFNPGHAPPEVLEQALALLPEGGLLVFSLNDHATEEAAFPDTIARVVSEGRARILSSEHGDHLPGIGLSATVYVLARQ